MERIGIFGGAFNPPHVGHLDAARYAAQALGLSRLLLIPSNISPHKQAPSQTANAQQRLEMTGLAAAGIPGLEVCDIELRREGISYTYQTIEQLAAEYPDAQLVLLMGTDMFLCFDSWKETGRILAHATLGVFCRGEKAEKEAIAAKKQQLEASGVRVELVAHPVTAISSTQLRRMLIFDCASPFLADPVQVYIRENGLYGTGRDYRNLSMAELEQTVVELLNPNRVRHVLGCRDTAAKLARYWGADETAAARAGLLHDVTKALDGPLQLTLCREYGRVLDEFSENNPKTLHALTGSLVAERVFGESRAVVDAIASHTTGKPGMNLLEKIIYVADYMEPNRDFPGVERLREMAYTDIDKALALGLQMTLDVLKEQGRQISPASAQALAYLQNTCL